VNLKKVLAWTVVGALAPPTFDVTINPYSDYGIVKSWLCGAATIGAISVLYWAMDEVGLNSGSANKMAANGGGVVAKNGALWSRDRSRNGQKRAPNGTHTRPNLV
jgi:hypothetical protein